MSLDRSDEHPQCGIGYAHSFCYSYEVKTIDILSELIAIRSESGQEAAVADYIETWIGHHTKHQATRIGDSILVFIRGLNQKKCLIFNGHIDTVKAGERSAWHTDPLKLTEANGKLHGLGASDMKGAVAAMMEMTARYQDAQPPCDIYCMFVVEEETTGNGTNDTLHNLKPQLKKYDDVAAVIGESTKLDAVLGHRGNTFAKVTFQGIGGHASRPPALADQAVHKAYAFIRSVEEQKKKWNHQYTDALLGGIGATVTAIEAGTGAMNQIPTEAVVTLDIRTVPAFHKVLEEELTQWTQAFNAKLEILYPCPAGFCDPSERIAKTVMKLAGQKDVQVTQGATDQQFFTQAGIPAVICGPGDKAVIHAPNEYIDMPLLQVCTERYMAIATDWAS